MKPLRSKDLTTVVSTAGTPICSENGNYRFRAFVNEGPNNIDIIWLDPKDGVSVAGRIRLLSGGSCVFSKVGDMDWPGALSAVAYNAETTLAGVEVEEWG